VVAARFGLDGRIVVVTGGIGRLGASFAHALVDAGARVAVVDTVADPARRTEALGDLPADRLRFYAADVTSKNALTEACTDLIRVWGRPFGLVNNAALDSPPNAPAAENGPFEDYPESSFDRVMEVNVKGAFLCSQVFGAAMAEAGSGSIVNIGSIYGIVAPDQALYRYRRERGEIFFKPAAYSVSKSALMNLTRYLAAYWGAAGVRVNTLVFGGVFAGQEREFVDAYVRKVPLGRMAEPSDYDGAVVFLMSDASRYMTGASLVVDGGFTAL
jgi:NAD(P)-dependent dehydrogenase (short-subunit alcohol dehydrogenase family)